MDDCLQMLPAGSIKLKGRLGKSLRLTVDNRLKKVNYKKLTETFRTHQDNDGFGRGEFWGKIVRSAIRIIQTNPDAELETMIRQTVRDLCDTADKNGWLGNVFEILSVMSRDDSDNDFYRNWLSQFKGGAFYIFAGYLIDIILQMLGTPDKVTSFLQKTRDDALIDSGLAVLEYPRATATARVSVAEIDGFNHRRLIICGTEGAAELCPIEPGPQQYYTHPLQVRLTLKKDCGPYTAGTHIVDCGTLNRRYDRQLIEFAKIVRKEISNPYPIEHEYLLHKTLLQACEFPV